MAPDLLTANGALDALEAWISKDLDSPVTNKKIRYQNRIELLQGTLDLLVLQTLM